MRRVSQCTVTAAFRTGVCGFDVCVVPCIVTSPPGSDCVAIVNAANEGCLGGGGIDGEVNYRGGDELQKAREALPLIGPYCRCKTDDSKITIDRPVLRSPRTKMESSGAEGRIDSCKCERGRRGTRASPTAHTPHIARDFADIG